MVLTHVQNLSQCKAAFGCSEILLLNVGGKGALERGLGRLLCADHLF